MQIYRLFEIVYVLLHQEIVTARELAERFGVSQRTIFRDIDILSIAGIPIYTEKGKGGGISLLPDFVLNKSILSEKEQNEVLTALHGLSKVKTADTSQVLQRLSTIFNKTAVNWLEVDYTDWGDDNSRLYDSFKTAILEHRIAEFDYTSIYGKTSYKKTRRRIEPLQLWFKSKAWYVKGFCLIQKDFRTFKLSRISELRITDEHFGERDLLANPQPADSGEKQKPPVTLLLKIAGEMSHRVFDDFSANQVKKQRDGSYFVTVSWPEDEWVYGSILSYGEYMEVLEPEHIRNIIREKTSKINKKYL